MNWRAIRTPVNASPQFNARQIAHDLNRSRRILAVITICVAFVLAVLYVIYRPFRGPDVLLNVSYDASQEFYRDVNKAFDSYVNSSGEPGIGIQMSHAGSTAQARSLLKGGKADLVSLATESDMDALEHAGLVTSNWRNQFPWKSSPYTSTMVFLVRKGNPKNIVDWRDLGRADVAAVAPSPGVSGAGKWIYLAVWGAGLREFSGDRDRTLRFVYTIYSNVKLLEEGARRALMTFVSLSRSDVFVTWESEAWQAVIKYGSKNYDVVYPPVSILAEPVVAVVDHYANERGTKDSALRYLQFLFTDEGQKIAAQNFLRPRKPGIKPPKSRTLPEITLFRVEDLFGSWEEAQRQHFENDGTFKRLHHPEQLKRSES
jgi:sulfate/thiosulfate-binding protein